MKRGYIRESTGRQELGLAAQRKMLSAYGCEELYEDAGQSGASNIESSPTWARLMEQLESGDELVVVSQSRLGRKSYEVTFAVGRLIERGVSVTVLNDNRTYTDLDVFEQNILLNFNSSMDHNERVIIGQRTRAGLSVLKEADVKLGRKPKLRERDVMQIRRLASEGFGFKTISKLIQLPPRRGEEPSPISVSLVKRALSDGYTTLEAWEAANAKARAALSVRSAA